MYASILVPVDGSELSLEAVRLATQLMPSSGGTIHLLNVPELPPATDELGRWVEASNPDISRDDAEQDSIKLLDRVRESMEQPGIEFQTTVQWGSPARGIVDGAKKLGVDAIVMGSSGMSDLKGLVIGSVSHKVMHTAPCRVILVR